MARWIQVGETMRRVESSQAAFCTHDIDLDDQCEECEEAAEYEGEDDDVLSAALKARKAGNPVPLVEYKSKMKGKAHVRR